MSLKKRSKKVKKLLAALLITAAPVAASVAVPTAAHAAPAVEINHGWCNQQVDPQLRFYLAPGAFGNGPFVIVNGDFKSTQGNGFEGYMGCYK
mgnify:CR=1 FL=1